MPSNVVVTMTVAMVTMPALEATSKGYPNELLASSRELRVMPGIISVVAMITGLAMMLVGYRWIRCAQCLSGFIVGGLVVALCFEFTYGRVEWIGMVTWVCFMVYGGMMGLIVFVAGTYWFGALMVGVAAGLLGGFVTNASLGFLVIPDQPDAFLIILMVLFGATGAMMTWILHKPAMLVAISFIGAQMLIWALGYLAGGYVSGADLEYYRHRADNGNGWHYEIPTVWWAYVSASLGLTAAGFAVQHLKTAKGICHRDACSSTSPGSNTSSTCGGDVMVAP